MNLVSHFESNLLHILRFALGQAPREQGLPLLLQEIEPPDCLSRTAVRLIQQLLSQGCTLQMARDSWQRESFLRRGEIKTGRLWERTPPENLGWEFTANSLRYLIWLTATDVSATQTKPPISSKPPTVGDQFLAYLIYDAVRVPAQESSRLSDQTDAKAANVAAKLRQLRPISSSVLFWLLYPEDMPDEPNWTEADFALWLTPPGLALLEGMQNRMFQRWCDLEAHKRQTIQPEKLRSAGTNQRRMLTLLANVLQRAERKDLARFLLRTLQRTTAWHSPQGHWFRRLDTKGLRMAAREELYRDGLALFHFADQLLTWRNEARRVGFADDGYAASQLWKQDWERYQGDRSCQLAHDIIRAHELLSV